MQQTTKLIGTEITTTTTFKNHLKVKFAPALVNLKYKPPNGAITTVVVLPDSTNNYTKSILLDVVGVWKFRWESVGDDAVADEFEVYVEESILN